jgi:hypothetical protein
LTLKYSGTFAAIGTSEVVAEGVFVPILIKHAVVASTRITTVFLLRAFEVAELDPETVTVCVVDGESA